MKCPYCMHTETKVVDKRETPDMESARRRRECLKCEKRFTTYERIELIDLLVVKKSGEKEQYIRDKLKKGIMKSLEKRPVTQEKVEQILDKIETKIRSYKETEIPSKKIGEELMRALKKLDKIAYIRFASVYRDFKDLEDFEEELKKIKG